MKQPDFAELRRIRSEVRSLAERGELTKAEYDRFFEEGTAAVGEYTEFLQGLIMAGVEHGFIAEDDLD